MFFKDKRGQGVLLFTFTVLAVTAAVASTALACVVFKGKLDVGGTMGQTTVVGSRVDHGYCSGGEPTTAAAGSPGSAINVSVAPAPASSLCADTPSKPNRLPDGTYDIRINRETGYLGADVNVAGAWIFLDGTGCFISANSSTTTILGTLNITGGTGTATATVNLDNPPGGYKNGPTDAAVLCVGPSSGGTKSSDGIFAPFQVL